MLVRTPSKPHTPLMQRIGRPLVLSLAFGVVAAACQPGVSEAPKAEDRSDARARPHQPFLARRAAHETQLDARGPSPGEWQEHDPPPGVARITYPSGELELAAWYATPLGAANHSAPALVYFHGDFAFGPDDFEVVRPFVDAGFVVMTPMLRGENGNPGDFELLWGEVDDARAAVEWVAGQSVVDRSRIYAFGHSIGGGVAAMLSLFPELPLRATGSCGGIYVPETFGRWAQSEGNAELIRFDPTDPDETELRVLGPNLEWMVHPHVAYVGDGDPWFSRNSAGLERRAWELGKPFEVVEVPGDHMGSLLPALTAFRERVTGDARR